MAFAFSSLHVMAIPIDVCPNNPQSFKNTAILIAVVGEQCCGCLAMKFYLLRILIPMQHRQGIGFEGIPEHGMIVPTGRRRVNSPKPILGRVGNGGIRKWIFDRS